MPRWGPPASIAPMTWIDAALRRVAGLSGASDAAVEPDDAGALRLRVRTVGVYQELDRCPADGAAAAMARLKALAGVPAYIRDEPQDGRIDGRPFGFAGDLRAAFLPTVRGVRAALRLPALGAVPPPEGLGLEPEVVAGLRRALRASQGLLLVCGPTGSGKTTTIHSVLAEQARTRPDRLLLAIEDPVERRLEGIVQVETAAGRGLDFAAALRAGLRHDPDVIMVGEIRDAETAQAALRAALTGHLVITTLHCARAHEAVPRLLEMGCARELLMPTLIGILAQRLLRVGAGLGQRRPVADWLPLDHAARMAWMAGAAPALAHDQDRTAAAWLAAGTTTAEEIDRVLG